MFERRLMERFPQFKKLTRPKLAMGLTAFEWVMRDDLRCYLVLQLHRSEDAFTLEVAWTKSGSWPVGNAPLPSAPTLKSPSGQTSFRVGLLWSAQPDHWWSLAPRPSARAIEEGRTGALAIWEMISNPPSIDTTLLRVPVCVDEAITAVSEYVVPYFERVARNGG